MITPGELSDRDYFPRMVFTFKLLIVEEARETLFFGCPQLSKP